MRILLAGGGSIGHIAPCVAVARALMETEPGTDIRFACSKRPEERAFLERERLPFSTLPIPRRSWKFPFTFLHSLRDAGSVLDTFHPNAIFCTGGAMNVPVALAARRRKIPVVLHEPDAIMGRASRMIARWADTICTGMPVDSYNLSPSNYNLTYTGIPVRPDLWGGNREEGLRLTGFSGGKPILLVLGGSQGAQALNEIVTAHLEELLAHCDVIHLTGPGKTGAGPRPGYWPSPFAQEELSRLYAVADVALSRGGANSIAELAANGIPAILVPLRGVAQDHQEANARAAERGGGCLVIEQEDLPATLLPTMARLCANPSSRTAMGTKIRALHRPETAKEIATIVLQTAQGK